jgi:hypothetical protein
MPTGAGTRRAVPAPNELPIEVRRAAWNRLWQILLCDPCHPDVEREPSELDGEAVDGFAVDGVAESAPRRELVRIDAA